MKKHCKINEQCYIRKNNEKFEQQNQCETSKQRKRLFQVYVKTKLYVAQNI